MDMEEAATRRAGVPEPPQPLSRAAATEYAAWFRALADPTRVQIVSLLARAGRPMTVGHLVEAAQVSQATVSQHMKLLAEVRFVLAERRGTARYYRLNDACVDSFPTAADLIMERFPASPHVPGEGAPGEGAPGAGEPAGGAQALREAAGDARDGEPGGRILIRPMRPDDAGQVLAIYQAGLDAGQASFETQAPSWEAFDAAKLPGHRHVAVLAGAGAVAGWAAVSAVSSRCVYAGVVEHSVYVDPGAHRRGAGFALLQALIASTEAAGIWTIQSGIFPQNTASLRLHERAGFRVVGTRLRMGRHHDGWRDVVLVERRSAHAGWG